MVKDKDEFVKKSDVRRAFRTPLTIASLIGIPTFLYHVAKVNPPEPTFGEGALAMVLAIGLSWLIKEVLNDKITEEMKQ